MAAGERVEVSTTERLEAWYVNPSTGSGVTGLSVTVRIRRNSDGYYLKNDGTFVSSPSTEYTATEASSSNQPGRYYFDFAVPAAADVYSIRFDGSASAPASIRYQFGELQAVDAVDPSVSEIADAVWNEATSGHTTAGTFGKAVTSNVAPILPLSSQVASPVDNLNNVQVFQNSDSPPVSWVITDADGDAIDLSSGTVTFNAYDRNNNVIITKSTGSGITVSGSDNNQVTMTYDTDDTANAATYDYTLSHTDSSTMVLAYGKLIIREAVV